MHPGMHEMLNYDFTVPALGCALCHALRVRSGGQLVLVIWSIEATSFC